MAARRRSGLLEKPEKKDEDMINAECPTCGEKYEIKEERVPASGARLKCVKCENRFLILPAKPAAPKPAPPPATAVEKMTCPRCAKEQDAADMCIYCGVVIAKWKEKQEEDRKAAEERQAQGANGNPPPAPDMSDEDPPAAEPEEPATDAQLTASQALFGCFVDFGFAENVTPALLKLGYALTVILGALVALGTAAQRIGHGEWTQAAITFGGYVVGVVYMRIMVEFLMVAFKIERNTRRGA